MTLGWDIVAGAHSGGRFFLGERPYVCDVYLADLSKWWKMREHLRSAASGVLRRDGAR